MGVGMTATDTNPTPEVGQVWADRAEARRQRDTYIAAALGRAS